MLLRFAWAATLVMTLAAPARAGDGDWFICTAKNRVHSNNPKHPVFRVLSERGKESTLHCVAFNVQDEWVTFDGLNAVFTCNNDIAPGRRIMELGKAGESFRWLAFTPKGGWVLLHGKNAFSADGIPKEARGKLAGLAGEAGVIRSVAFGPQGGWVIITESGVFGDGLPAALDKLLRARVEEKVAVRCVAFDTQGDWFVVDGRNECSTSNPAHAASKKMQELRADGETVQWIAFAPGDSPTGYVLDHTPTRRVKAVLEFAVEEPGGGVTDWTIVAAKAPNIDRQRDATTTLLPGGKPGADAGPLKRPVLITHIQGQPKGTKATLTIEASLVATRMRPRLPGDPPAKAELDAAAIKLYTRATETLDFKAKVFQEWLDRFKMRRGSDETDFAFAKRAFAFLRRSLAYQKEELDDFRVSTVCRTGKSDCGGMAYLYVATLRANQIPARALPGRLAQSEKPPPRAGDPPDIPRHVRAEFFAKGMGWVPVDPALGTSDPGRGEFSWFGNDPGDLIVMHIDPDFLVDTLIVGHRPVISLQGLGCYRKGGTGAGQRLLDHWTVK